MSIGIICVGILINCDTVTVTKSDSIGIGSVADIDKIRQNLNGDFILLADIDLERMDFQPIAPNTISSIIYQGTAFTGTFDGNGKTIKNLKVSDLQAYYMGFFGLIGEEGVVRNVKLELVQGQLNGSSIGGSGNAGALAGMNNGRIENSVVIGGFIQGGSNIGGLVGSNNGSIKNSYSTAELHGHSYVGGLVGRNIQGGIEMSYAVGAITVTSFGGGLVGKIDSGYVKESYATGAVITGGSTGNHIGGLVGEARGPITNSYATGEVAGRLTTGGLVGLNANKIENSYATGRVTRTGSAVSGTVGGLIGENEADGSIIASYFDGEQTKADNQTSEHSGTGNNQGSGVATAYYTVDTTVRVGNGTGYGEVNKDDFLNWDFTGRNTDGAEDIWHLARGGQWPILAWQ